VRRRECRVRHKGDQASYGHSGYDGLSTYPAGAIACEEC
jgi:hypothetical protein